MKDFSWRVEIFQKSKANLIYMYDEKFKHFYINRDFFYSFIVPYINCFTNSCNGIRSLWFLRELKIPVII